MDLEPKDQKSLCCHDYFFWCCRRLKWYLPFCLDITVSAKNSLKAQITNLPLGVHLLWNLEALALETKLITGAVTDILQDDMCVLCDEETKRTGVPKTLKLGQCVRTAGTCGCRKAIVRARLSGVGLFEHWLQPVLKHSSRECVGKNLGREEKALLLHIVIYLNKMSLF